MGRNAHLHVANAKDSVVQILQSLSASDLDNLEDIILMILWILNDFYRIFKEIVLFGSLWFVLPLCLWDNKR